MAAQEADTSAELARPQLEAGAAPQEEPLRQLGKSALLGVADLAAKPQAQQSVVPVGRASLVGPAVANLEKVGVPRAVQPALLGPEETVVGDKKLQPKVALLLEQSI